MSSVVDVSTIIYPKPPTERETEFFFPRPVASSPMPGEWRSSSPTDALQRFIVQLENDASLAEPNRLRERLDALDRLDAYLPCTPQDAAGEARFGQELSRRARAIRDRFEAVNADLYDGIRCQIQRGLRPHGLLRWLPASLPSGDIDTPADGTGYDYKDELMSGVFRFEEPEDGHILRDAEKLLYQPTPARHIFSLIGLTALTPDDVFMDLGSGLGQVPMMVSICTESRCFGIELEATYVERAQQCARGLNLTQVTFLQQDVRQADLSSGTVFYLYTPFMGSILSAVLGRLRLEGSARPIRICCYGPCTSVVAGESWLVAATPPDENSITVFCSRT